MKHFALTRALALVCAIFLSAWTPSGAARVVATESGQVSGVVRNGALEFRGIPYAAAPKGELRWALAQPPAAWSGVRDGSRFGPACPQQARFGLTDSSADEDCLSVNVSVPADLAPGEKLPVFIWIHGGAFVGGSSDLYRLDRLVTRGRIVVVSVNYRIGVLGFMPHPAFETADKVNGNYGIEDQRAAMQWVQRNIAAFGGDPNHVTVGGESAGAGSICMHLASPEKVEGLFHRAIVMSAGCLQSLKTVGEAELAGRAIVESLGCRGSQTEVLKCLRSDSMTVERLLKAEADYADANPLDLLAFAPVIGTAERPNATIPRSVRVALQNDRLLAIPLLIGGASHEVRLYVGYWWQAWKAGAPRALPVNAAGFDQWLRQIYPGSPAGSTRSFAEQIREVYVPAGGWASDRQAAEALGAILSDYSTIPINHCNFLMANNAFAAYAARTNRPLRVHHFEFADHNAPVAGVGIAKPYPDFTLGAVHSSILNYVFPNYSNSLRIDAPELPAGSRKLADQITDSWTRFVKTGNPGGGDLPNWPAYTGPGQHTLRFAPDQAALHDAALAHRCTFWRGLYPERLN
jgi:para-nitrobenzyl esterase